MQATSAPSGQNLVESSFSLHQTVILHDRFRYRHTFIWNRFFSCQEWVTAAYDDFVEWQLHVSYKQLHQLSIIHLHVLCELWAREEEPRFALAGWESSVCLPDSRDSEFASHFTVQTRSLAFSRTFFLFPPSERNSLALVRWWRGESRLQISTALKWSACCRKEVDETSRGCNEPCIINVSLS